MYIHVKECPLVQLVCQDDEVAFSASARTSSSGAMVATLQNTLAQEGRATTWSCLATRASGECHSHMGVLCPDCGVGVPGLLEHCIQ